eukprot:5609996-Pyramimonas_sp.AAC.1
MLCLLRALETVVVSRPHRAWHAEYGCYSAWRMLTVSPLIPALIVRACLQKTPTSMSESSVADTVLAVSETQDQTPVGDRLSKAR